MHITGAWDGSVGTLKQRIVALAAGEEVDAISSEQWMELTQWVRGISTSRARGDTLPLGRRLLKAFCPGDGLALLFAATKVIAAPLCAHSRARIYHTHTHTHLILARHLCHLNTLTRARSSPLFATN